MSIKALLRQDCIIYPQAGHDRYGHDTLGTGVPEKCRFQNVTKQMLQPNGDTLTIDATVVLASDTSATPESRIEVNGQKYIVADYNGIVDGRGRQHHVTCGVQKWQG